MAVYVVQHLFAKSWLSMHFVSTDDKLKRRRGVHIWRFRRPRRLQFESAGWRFWHAQHEVVNEFANIYVGKDRTRYWLRLIKLNVPPRR